MTRREHDSSALCWYGVLLFALGLVYGAAIPFVTNPRMGLSAHLTGVQSGIALALFGLMWPKLSLAAPLARANRWLCVVSLYALFLSLVLASLLGTSGATPIAGAGFEGTASAERLVDALLYPSSAGILIASAILLYGLAPRRAAGSGSA